MRTLLILLALCFGLHTNAAPTVILNAVDATCGYANGRINPTIYGGLPPYTFAWTGPNGFTSTSESLVGLSAGIYSLTLTDSQLGTWDYQAEVGNMAELLSGTGGSYSAAYDLTGYWGGACPGECNGTMAMVDELFTGTPPFTYTFSVPVEYLGTTPQGYPVYTGFCLDEYVTYSFTDYNGCTGIGEFTVYGVHESDHPNSFEVVGTCTGGTAGSISFLAYTEVPASITLTLNGQVLGTGSGYLGNEVTFTYLGPGDYVIMTEYYDGACPTQAFVTVPDLGTGCGTLSGSSWYDLDADCIHDWNEVGIPGRVLSIEPGGYYALTQSDGSFALDVPNGSYTLAQTDPTLVPICPAVQPVPFTMGNAPVTIDLANGSTALLDLKARITGTAARPGFHHSMHAKVRNASPQLSGPVTAVLTYDPAMTFLNANPTPTSLAGNVLTWEWNAFTSFEERSAHVHFNIPQSTPLGTALTSTWTATNTLPEADITNNSATEHRTVTGSFDPNAKEVLTSSRSSDAFYYINTDEYLDYTIQFQNTGTDTAFTVVITDTLGAEMDMTSFQQGVSSHPVKVDFKAGRVVEWTFSNIHLPDSNTNEAASHGLTSFRIKLNEPVLPGAVIENIANIYFDFNEPVITEPATITVTLPSVAIAIRALLGGPYAEDTHQMSDQLRANGLIPLTEPYTALGYAHVNGGGETTTPAALATTGDNAIVDWVVLELRAANNPSTVLATRSALVQRDGDVVDVDGISPVSFSMPAGNYHIAIRHRNHLGCMSADPVTLSGTPASLDLSAPATATWGTDARKNVDGTLVLWSGDCRGDGDLKYAGTNNDRDVILTAIGGLIPTSVITGYRLEDANMDGKVKYIGANNDRDPILLNIGGYMPTRVITEQLP